MHLNAVRQMFLYFALSGHTLYAKSAYVYLQMMLNLPKSYSDVYQTFINGFHVVRRSDRYWAGLQTDLVIEQVLMKNIKTCGGLTRGRGITEILRLLWVLSMPACT